MLEIRHDKHTFISFVDTYKCVYIYHDYICLLDLLKFPRDILIFKHWKLQRILSTIKIVISSKVTKQL